MGIEYKAKLIVGLPFSEIEEFKVFGVIGGEDLLAKEC